MNAPECFREGDVVNAMRNGEWPDRCEPGLRDHVSACPVCSEVAAIAAAIREDMDGSMAEVRVPSAAHVWWRAQMRARHEAMRTAERPMTIVEGIAAASAVGTASAAIAVGWAAVSWGWLKVPAVSEFSPATLALVVGAAAAVLLVPVALYFAVSER